MKGSLEKLHRLESDFLLTSAKPRVGYLCMRVPVELIEAYGAIPQRIVSRTVSYSDALPTVRNDACSFCRSVTELLKSEPYGRLSAIIAGQCCDQMRRLMDSLSESLTIPVILFGAPRTYGTDENYFMNEMKLAFERLGGAIGGELDYDMLVQTVNQRQQLRNSIQSLRNSDSRSSRLLQRIVSSPLPTETLFQFVEELGPDDSSDPNAVRLMLFGSIPSGKELDIIEELGGWVVADGTCLGDRVVSPFAEQEGIKGGVSDPMRFLYRYYIEGNNCPLRRPYTSLIEYVKNLITERRAEGIIYRSVKYCHPFGLSVTRFRSELNVPFLQIDDDLTLQATTSFRTRIGAFIEMLEMKKNTRKDAKMQSIG